MKTHILIVTVVILLSSFTYGWSLFMPESPPPHVTAGATGPTALGTTFEEINRFWRNGTDADGLDNNTGRNITINNTITSLSNKLVIVDNYLLNDSYWNFTHGINNTNISFVYEIWNESEIMIDIFIDQFKPYEGYEISFDGTDATGTDGDINRTILLSATTELPEWEMIKVDEWYLIENLDYVISKSGGTTIIFLNELWDSQEIEVNYLQNED